mgnify:CR=1 FL=1
MAEAGETLTRDKADLIQAKGVNEGVLDVEGAAVKVFSNHMIDMKDLVSFDPEECVRSELALEAIKRMSAKSISV